MQNTSEILQLFSPQTLQEQILLPSARLAKISQWLDGVQGSQAQKVALSSTQLPSLLASDQVYLSGKMLREHSPQTLAQTFGQFSKPLPTLGVIDLNGNCLIQAGVLPQNRERIYLIGHLAGRSEPGVFPIREDDCLPTTKTQSQFQAQLSGTIKANGNMNADDTYIIPKTASTLTGGGKSGGLHSDMTVIQVGTYRTHNEGKGFRKVKSNIAPTIPARARKDGSGMPVIRQLPRGKNKGADLKICPTISSNAFQENNLLCGIRRLTEIECERLQGFPDNWTQYGNYNDRKRRISKTQRYKLIGNAVTVDIVTMIAKRLKFRYEEKKRNN